MLKQLNLILILIILLSGSCGSDDESPALTNETPITYKNPVFEPVLADPSIVRSGEYFYAYGTEDDWGSNGGYHMVPIIRSADLVNWEYIADAFKVKPSWKNEGGLWAPDVTLVEGKYYMYYSYSTWGDNNPGIGLAIADQPHGPFIDQGKVFLSDEIEVNNSIDPFYIEENNNKYLFWGSFHGIYAVQLAADARGVSGEKVKIAYSHLEAAYIHRKEDYYYLFGSEGSCCAGAGSTYQVRVGRSQSLLGPYIDKDGNDMASGVHGEILIRGNEEDFGFAGPGHNAEIITDDEGTDWFLYHAIKKTNPLLDNGATRRPLMLDKISWEAGWPVITGQQPSLTSQPVPVFNK